MRPGKTQISLGIHPVWSDSLLSPWRKLGSFTTHWVHSKDSNQTGRMPRLICLLGAHIILLVLSCAGSFVMLVTTIPRKKHVVIIMINNYVHENINTTSVTSRKKTQSIPDWVSGLVWKTPKYLDTLISHHTCPKILTSPIYCSWSVWKTAGWVANSVDPNQMPHPAPLGMGLYCWLRPVCLDTYFSNASATSLHTGI